MEPGLTGPPCAGGEAISRPEVDAEREVVLARGGEVAGVVVDPWGTPVPGAAVHAVGGKAYDEPLDTGDLRPGPVAAARRQSATTDAEGRFVLAGIAAFPVRLTATRPQWACPIRKEHDLAGPTDDVRLVMRPHAQVGVRAFDAVTRRPLGHLDVSSATPNTWARSRLRAVPAADGTTRVESWTSYQAHADLGPSRPRSAAFRVVAWGYRTTAVDLALRYPDEDGYQTPQDVYLDPLPSRDSLGRVLVRVSYPALGRPPRRVTLVLHSDRLDLPTVPSRDPESKPTASGEVLLEDGRAELELPTGGYLSGITSPGAIRWPSPWTAFEVKPAGTTPLDLTVPGALVEVRAYGPGRASIPFFSASTQGGSTGQFRWHGMLLDPMHALGLEDEIALLGAEPGRITLSVGPGSRRPPLLAVTAEGYEPWFQALTVEEGERYEIEAVLTPEEGRR